MVTHLVDRLIGALLALAVCAPAVAQTSAPDGGRARNVRWEVAGFGGLLSPQLSGGAGKHPPAAAAIFTSSPVFPGRQAPTWFFDDGAIQVNAVNAELGLPNRLMPLDSALPSMRLDAVAHAAIGLRISRTMTPRVSIEFALDAMPGSAGLGASAQAAVESTRASFESAFGALLSSGPFTSVNVKANETTLAGASREIATTTSLVVRFESRTSSALYAIAGGGAIIRSGELPSVSLEGAYRFRISGVVPIDETDRIAVRYERRPAPIAVLGAGWRRDVSDRWGWRIDGRFFIGHATSRLFIDTSSSIVRGDPAGFIESLTYPNIQFSNNPSTGRVSTLGGPPLQGFDPFFGDRIQARFLLNIGVLRKF